MSYPPPFMSNDERIEQLSRDLLEALHDNAGGHPGCRPVHAKGAMCLGTFVPTAEGKALTRAPHVQRNSVPVIVRYSNDAGDPAKADNDPATASPRGCALRFQLGEHEHTDIIAHSTNGFPARTGEEFLALQRAVAASAPGAPKPTPIERFLEAYPAAKRFVMTPKPIPTSFAHESFFGLVALRFTNREGISRFGRFRLLPEAGNEYLDDSAAAAKDPNFLFEELDARLSREPIKVKVVVQLAEPGDTVNDVTVQWPEERPQIQLGTVTLTKRVSEDDEGKRRIIFDPIPRVDGIDPTDDPLFEIRSAIYLLSGRRRRAESAALAHAKA